MMILYFVNGLIKTYFVTLLIVPLSYVASEVSLYTLLKELWVFSKSILDFNVFVFVTFIFISTILFLSFSKKTFGLMNESYSVIQQLTYLYCHHYYFMYLALQATIII